MKHLVWAVVLLAGAAGAARGQERQQLAGGWLIQSSARAGTDGARISSPEYTPAGWYGAGVPSTVVGTLVEDGVFRDPFFGMNLRSIPGMTYEVGYNFAHGPMAPTSPYAVPWWYRTTFRLPAAMRGRRVTLRFDGINYRANVWLDGRLLADSSRVAGTYRRYDLDVTDVVSRSGDNVLAVEVFAPTPMDLQTTWVDWNPAPPDKDMGLWQPVWVMASGPVVIRYPQVVSRVDTATLESAELTVGTDLRNLTSRAVTGTLSGRIGGVAIHRTVTLAPLDSAYVRFTPDSFPQLHFAHPRLWWPAELGRPELYDLHLGFAVDGAVSDSRTTRFGIREITSELTGPRGVRLFRVNGRRILVRGGGWAPDMFFRPQPGRQLTQLRYALDMGLNTIRLEGNYENDRFWQDTDSLGLLVMTGWVCCSAWEQWKDWKPEQYAVAAASLRDQIRRLRSHASALVWLNGSDNPPPADVERLYLGVEEQEHWPNPTLSSASAKPAGFTGPSGVKMTGPYDWVPPSYWLQDTTHGGGWGFNTETSPGPAVPPLETMRLMLPARDLWPIDSVWMFHAAGGQFRRLLTRFDTALTRRYGAPASAEEYTRTAQLMTYEGERAMFEAYRRNAYASTGVIQWMLNDAWPSVYWHLFDWYLRPGGGYFGAKVANEPVHVMFSYDDRSVAVVSAARTGIRGVHLHAGMLTVDGARLFSRDTVIDVPADSSMRVLTLPEPAGVSGAYFVDLRLTDADGRALSTSFYWLSTRPDMLADTSTWYMTPVTRYADLTALRRMPAAAVDVSVRFTRSGDSETAHVTLRNTGKTLAFFVRLEVTKGAGGEEVLPVFWQDNYVSLLPGETRRLVATYRLRDLGSTRPVVKVTGWNVSPRTAR